MMDLDADSSQLTKDFQKPVVCIVGKSTSTPRGMHRADSLKHATGPEIDMTLIVISVLPIA